MRFEADKDDDNILRRSYYLHKLEHISVTVSCHERSQNSNRTSATVWNADTAAKNYGQNKYIEAAKHVERKPFGKLWFLSCNLGQN